jgi:hypothetical protein
MVDYVATLHLEARMVVGSETYDFQARGTSPEMAIQEVALEAITRLRYEHQELWEDPFTYLPEKGPEESFGCCVSPPVGLLTLERCMAETTSAHEWAHQSLLWELEETRRRLYNLQVRVELYTRMRKVPKKVIDELPQYTPQEEAPPHRFRHMVGAWAEARQTYNPISMGLHMRRFHVMPATRESLLGAPELFDP